ncbi:hypothetical protein A3736_07190 [Erythrobacter sp. HI0063]|uniref:hypothetical protein n=1 Tax=Erythrobacter sp. HI0063 TaxID=1822240 RepID=UPI0007C386CF|nr:hypothetical protein [Erythrobacter sp. HI0063]KZY56819.1 hypothetical protein A3736_07190 [Erythrobacter sp. HI0063]
MSHSSSLLQQAHDYSARRKTYRARALYRHDGLTNEIEFEAEHLAAAIQTLSEAKNCGSSVVEDEEKRLGTVHLINPGQWWFTSL